MQNNNNKQLLLCSISNKALVLSKILKKKKENSVYMIRILKTADYSFQDKGVTVLFQKFSKCNLHRPVHYKMIVNNL